MKRYFIVFNRWQTLSGGIGKGYVSCNTTGFYPNNTSTRKEIEKNTENCKEGSVIITNIIELNESDYKDFVK